MAAELMLAEHNKQITHVIISNIKETRRKAVGQNCGAIYFYGVVNHDDCFDCDSVFVG